MAGQSLLGRRRHLFEIEDQPWLPQPIRDGVTGYLNYIGNLDARPYQGFCDALAAALRTTGERELLDLCSGSAGPLPTLIAELDRRDVPVRVRLTDLFPNAEAMAAAASTVPGRIFHETRPVDATAVPAELAGFRLLCNAFHHFRPAQARAILADAVAQRRGIALFEGVGRYPASIATCMVTSLGVLATSLLMRPVRWSRLALTWVVPAIPLVATWDGVVSCLRVYSPDELRELLATVPGAEDYTWQIETEPLGRSPMRVTWLVGAPRA
ncbi:hypothetical protein SAMN02745121_03182 [Nannocystis exedens]|uniref:Methyltransferase domain-containing protein n=1 Tax=Nannocystis exedens TaxID=54 RepID=A0A1I1Y5F2_9BACT|nr:class I SAM-dependent methyltransferase [Nannocystis exedens]PCC71830.1 hypothetical protein NAEX_04909 [Nannocystis exedens]SFE14885.1 hypothetical protein SAMN02745121_03182 [Nannocystis exedens]